MMDITKEFIEANSKSERKLGRFSTSDVWAILNGYLTPENYFVKEILPLDKILMMWNGTIRHYGLNSTLKELGYEPEVKTEYKTTNWTLVGKADGVSEKDVLELKTSDKIMEKAKSWHETQVKIYCSLFDKPEGIIYQPILNKNSIYLKELGRVKCNEKWFQDIIIKLNDFYQKLCQLQPPK